MQKFTIGIRNATQELVAHARDQIELNRARIVLVETQAAQLVETIHSLSDAIEVAREAEDQAMIETLTEAIRPVNNSRHTVRVTLNQLATVQRYWKRRLAELQRFYQTARDFEVSIVGVTDEKVELAHEILRRAMSHALGGE